MKSVRRLKSNENLLFEIAHTKNSTHIEHYYTYVFVRIEQENEEDEINK